MEKHGEYADDEGHIPAFDSNKSELAHKGLVPRSPRYITAVCLREESVKEISGRHKTLPEAIA